MRLDPRGLTLVVDHASHRGVQLLVGRRGVVRLEYPGRALEDLLERPIRYALAVGKRAASVPPDALGPAFERLPQLPDEPALSDSGNADQRHELDGLVSLRPRQRVEDEREL